MLDSGKWLCSSAFTSYICRTTLQSCCKDVPQSPWVSSLCAEAQPSLPQCPHGQNAAANVRLLVDSQGHCRDIPVTSNDPGFGNSPGLPVLHNSPLHTNMQLCTVMDYVFSAFRVYVLSHHIMMDQSKFESLNTVVSNLRNFYICRLVISGSCHVSLVTFQRTAALKQ